MAAALAVLGLRLHGDDPDRTAAPRSRPTRLSLGTPTPEILLARDAGPFTLDGTTVTFPDNPRRRGALRNQVERVDLTTGARTLVGRSAFPHGFINWAVSSGPWTVYTDQSDVQGEGGRDRVLWRVIAINVETQEKRVLASNHDKRDPFVPQPLSSDGYVFWSSAEPDRSARESLWKPEWPTPRPLLQRADFVPTSETVADGWMYFLAPPSKPTKGRSGTDCWRVRLDGTDRQALTESGRVMSCEVAGDRLLWDVHVDPEVVPFESENYSDNPYELWTRVLGEEPVLVHRGYFYGSGPLIGRDFFAWEPMDGGGTRIQSIRSPALSKELSAEAGLNEVLTDTDYVVVLTETDSYRTYAQLYDLNEIRTAP